MVHEDILYAALLVLSMSRGCMLMFRQAHGTSVCPNAYGPRQLLCHLGRNCIMRDQGNEEMKEGVRQPGCVYDVKCMQPACICSTAFQLIFWSTAHISMLASWLLGILCHTAVIGCMPI